MEPFEPTASADIVQDNLVALRELFPEAFTEGKIDFDVLKQLLGGAVDEREEKYGLNWHGKRKARQLALTPSTGTLRPCPGEGIDEETTQNIVIEGDNLEVLKLLQKSYSGKVKLIYIDPPYNTGKDFVYPDNFQDNIRNYLIITGQIEGGAKVTSNPESSGRFHTDWLCMMLPRIKLARNLLRDDGILAISCDDSELSRLIIACCDVFGEENIVGTIVNVNNPKGRSDDLYLATAHEYLLLVAKQADMCEVLGFEPEEHITRRYNKVDSKGRYREIDLRKTGDNDRREDRPNLFYYFYYSEETKELDVSKERILNSGKHEIVPMKDNGQEGNWRWSLETSREQIANLTARFMPNRKIWGVFEKDYLEGRGKVKSTSVWAFKEVNSERGSEQFIELGFDKYVFARPKPLGLMHRLFSLITTGQDNELILDFFAGSGTTGHAVMAHNATDGGTRRFVLVQLPEPLDQENKDQKTAAEFCDSIGKPRNITELTKERLRRARNKVITDNPMFSGDTGFRVFKLDTSNIRTWEPDRVNLSKTLEESMIHIKSDRAEADILTELLLKLGLDLTVPIETETIAKKKVYSVGAGVLLVCLDESVSRKEAEPLALGIVKWHKELAPAGESTVVFRDSAFEDDVAKSNLAAILQQHGLTNVRSL